MTEVEIQASDASDAIVAAAKVALPPRTIELRILDNEGREVFSRAEGRSLKEAQMIEKTPELYLAGYFIGREASVGGGSDSW